MAVIDTVKSCRYTRTYTCMPIYTLQYKLTNAYTHFINNYTYYAVQDLHDKKILFKSDFEIVTVLIYS